MVSTKILLIVGVIVLIFVVAAFVILNRIARQSPSIVRPEDAVNAEWMRLLATQSVEDERATAQSFVESARERNIRYAVSVYLEASDTPLPPELGATSWGSQTDPLSVSVTWAGQDPRTRSRWKPIDNAHIDILTQQ